MLGTSADQPRVGMSRARNKDDYERGRRRRRKKKKTAEEKEEEEVDDFINKKNTSNKNHIKNK